MGMSKYLQITFGVLLALKLTGNIDCAWTTVLAPMLIDAAVGMIIGAAMMRSEDEEEADEAEAK